MNLIIICTQGLKNIAFGTPGKYLGSPKGPNTGIMTKGTSVPQIVINGIPIGGFEHLLEYFEQYS